MLLTSDGNAAAHSARQGTARSCQFRNADDPDAFVWLHGLRDMASRARGLQAFYGGPVWAAHRNAANATMIDSDNVLLLLRPAWEGSGVLAPTARSSIHA